MSTSTDPIRRGRPPLLPNIGKRLHKYLKDMDRLELYPNDVINTLFHVAEAFMHPDKVTPITAPIGVLEEIATEHDDTVLLALAGQARDWLKRGPKLDNHVEHVAAVERVRKPPARVAMVLDEVFPPSNDQLERNAHRKRLRDEVVMLQRIILDKLEELSELG